MPPAAGPATHTPSSTILIPFTGPMFDSCRGPVFAAPGRANCKDASSAVLRVAREITVADAEARPRQTAWYIQAPPTEPRERIIAAASRCLARSGLERTSISAIAREARVSRQTIYNHFETKPNRRTSAGDGGVQRRRADQCRRETNTLQRDSSSSCAYPRLTEYSRNPAISPVIPTSSRRRRASIGPGPPRIGCRAAFRRARVVLCAGQGA